MNAGFLSPVRRFLRSFAGPAGADADDERLLGAFAAGRDAGAFKALVHKHGPLVLGVCRRLLGHEQDAEDAFQATFLVLARKAAAGIRPRLLAGWLYEVACRTARKALGQAARRRLKERQAARMPTVDPDSHALSADVRAVVDEEISRLPRKYRTPVVLCYLQGKTNEQAAELLGCPKGTVVSRLAWARDRLRARLVRRGLAPSAGLLAAALSADQLSAAVPAALADRTAGSALAFAWGPVAAQATPDPVPALAEGVLTTMSRTKVATALVVVLVLGLLGTGAGIASFYLQGEQPPQGQAPNPKAEAGKGGRLQELLKKRRDVAVEEYQIRIKQWQVGKLADRNLLFDVALRLFDAELALSNGRAARTAACKAHLARMKQFVAMAKSRLEAARGTAADLLTAQYYVLDAEIRLERDKTE